MIDSDLVRPHQPLGNISIVPSKDFESCVLRSWEAIGPYFHRRGMLWEYSDRLALFKQTELYKVMGEQELGFFMLWMREEKLFIADLHIYEDRRNRGLGSMVLEHIECMASSRGLFRIWLRVFRENPAVSLYKRHGFQIETEEENGYLMSLPIAPKR